MQLTEEVTRWLDAWSAGEEGALDRLLPLVWDDLRGMARRYLLHERENHTLQPTALVHEVYLRLADRRRLQWANRAQFFASMAEIMRFVLVDHARRKKVQKRGGDRLQVTLDEPVQDMGMAALDLIALDDALTKLTALNERHAQMVELRFFSGMSVEETATAMGVSKRTVER